MQVELIDFMGNDKRVVQAARVSRGKDLDDSTDEQDLKLMTYLYRNGHTTPFEHCTMTFRIECPLYVRTHIMRHRTFSYNEISRRYTSEDVDYKLPDVLRNQSGMNKQSSHGEHPASGEWLFEMRETLDDVMRLYDELIYHGIAREHARVILPECTLTTFYMTGNVHNFMKLFTLRLAPDAQKETQEVVQDMYQLFRATFPLIAKVYENVALNKG